MILFPTTAVSLYISHAGMATIFSVTGKYDSRIPVSSSTGKSFDKLFQKDACVRLYISIKISFDPVLYCCFERKYNLLCCLLSIRLNL
jgi:hypothetical protein